MTPAKKTAPAKAATKAKPAGRSASTLRNTNETQLKASLNIDGTGKFSGSVGVPFFEHMLNLFTRHAMFDISLSGRGDMEIDAHHTVEDCGILLGQCLKTAVGDKAGMARYGSAYLPMEESLARAVVDVCNRPYFRWEVDLPKAKVGEFDVELAEEFFRALAVHGSLTLHITVLYGSNLHHILEATFKAVGLALRQATAIDPRVQGVLSTKGKLAE